MGTSLKSIPVASAVFFVLLVLPGCLSDTSPSGDRGAGSTEMGAEAPPGTGEIRGLVSTALYEPLASVTVDLLDQDRRPVGPSAETSTNGSFAFGGVMPGAYLLAATRHGYALQFQPAQVKAGETTEVRFRLERDRSIEPYVIETNLVGLHRYGYNWHVEVPGEGCVSAGGVPTCGSRNPFNSENWNGLLTVDNDTRTILMEMQWDPAIPEGGYLWMDLFCSEVEHIGVNTNMYYGQVSDPDHVCYFPPARQTSPVAIRVDDEHWETHAYEHLTWGWRVVPGYGMLGGGETAGADVGAVYEQTYEVLFSVFQHEASPEGYSRVPNE